MSNGSERDVVNAVSQTGQTLQQTRAPYSTAVSVQIPRDLDKVRRGLMAEARIGGEMFFYGWGAGENHIEGPSIHLAMAAARCWGNCAVFPEPVQDGGDSWIFTTAFVDLETGFTLQRQFRQSKRSIVHGKHDAERKDDIRFQIGQSKASRNVVVNALPKTIINEAMAVAKAGVRERLETWIAGYDKGNGAGSGLAKAQDHALEALQRHGIDEERVLAKLKRPTRAALTLDDIILLKGDFMALEEGNDRVENLFPDPDAGTAADGVMDHLAENEPKPGVGEALTLKPDPKPKSDPPSGGGQGPQKPASRKKKGADPRKPTSQDGGTAQGAPDDSQGDLETATGDDWGGLTDEFLTECLAGTHGPEVQGVAMEFKARYARLADDPLSVSKYTPNWDGIREIQGYEGVHIVKRIEAHYHRLAKEAGYDQEADK